MINFFDPRSPEDKKKQDEVVQEISDDNIRTFAINMN